MKCWKCGSEIEEGAMHCIKCGALVHPTNKLMQSVSVQNKEAIRELYRICYGSIYNELLSIGLDEERSKDLVNKVFQTFLETMITKPLEELMPSLIGLADHIGFTYMKEHNLEPKNVSHEEVYIPITEDMIEQMFDDLKAPKEVKTKPKKHHKKFVIPLLIVIALVIAGGFYGITTVTRQQKEKKINSAQKKSYLKVTDEYVAAVNRLSVDTTLLKNTKKLKKAYPQTYKPARLAIKHKMTINQLQCLKFDVDGDGLADLLIGYKNTNGKFFVTGIYCNKEGYNKAINTNAISKVNEQLIFTKNHQVFIKYKGTYQKLKLNRNDQYVKDQVISDFKKYLKKNKTNEETLQAESVKSYYKKESNGKQMNVYKNLPANDQMQKWLDAYQAEKYDTCNTLASEMPEIAEEAGTSSMPKEMKVAYKKVVQTTAKEHTTDDDYFGGYYLSDLDGDGTMELMVGYTKEGIRYLNVYKYSDNVAKRVVKDYGYDQIDGRMTLYAYSGHPGVIALYRHNSVEGVEVDYLSGNKMDIKDYGGRDLHEDSDDPSAGGDYVSLGNELDAHYNAATKEIDYSVLEQLKK